MSAAAAGLKSINCTSCGAGLSVLGGGRVLSQVCGYCGAVLDAQDNYKVLDSIGKRNHPDSPVQIGMTLHVDGVEFTVIGTLGMVEKYRGREWRWVEHQIFSPTHGYLWLNLEDGNLTVTRKVRDYDMRHWLSPSTVERAETPPKRSYGGVNYRYYETSTAQIDFMEGEFNWIPKLREQVEVVSLLGPDAMVELVKSPREREVEITRLLPRAEAARDLGVEEAAFGPAKRHPLEPYKPLRDEGFLRKVFMFTAVAAALMGLFFATSSGREVLATPAVSIAQMPQSFQFEIKNASQLARVEFATTFQNQWASLAAELRGPDGEILLAGERTVSFYSGREGGENWSEGSRQQSFRFHPPEEGVYTVTMEYLEGEAATGSVVLRIFEGKPTGFWGFALAALAGLGWLFVKGRSAMHQKRRFAGSDWTDED